VSAPWTGEEAAESVVSEEVEETRVIAEEVLSLEDPSLLGWRARAVIHVRAYDGGAEELRRLSSLLKSHPGPSQVVLHLRDADGEHQLDLGAEYCAAGEPALEAEVIELYGLGSYRLEAVRPAAPSPRLRGRNR
jgi:hypothetical protein